MKCNSTILGAIAGDVIGSPYEWNNIKTTDFPLFKERSDFTDDTVLTVAAADCILNGKDYGKTLHEYGRRYRGRGYGGRFRQWLKSDDPRPYNSYGNGSAMRVSPVGFAFSTIDEVLEEARLSAVCTHSHPEGIRGAQAAAAAVFLARTGSSKYDIRNFIQTRIGYDLSFTLEQIRPCYSFDVTCQGSVPQAIAAFLESNDYEHAVRLAVSIGGDSDTIACITGGIASAFYGGVPDHIKDTAAAKLPDEFLEVITCFDEKFGERR
jgi:ADP-ribosylglycohydrolase